MGVDKTYNGDKIAVRWQSDLCIHCEDYIRKEDGPDGPKGLPEVFDLEARPWINMSGASEGEIIKQVGKCPTGAISIVEPQQEATELKCENSPATKSTD